jgi:hypothetical protein
MYSSGADLSPSLMVNSSLELNYRLQYMLQNASKNLAFASKNYFKSNLLGVWSDFIRVN